MESSNDKIFSVLSYIGFLWLVPLLVGNSEFTKFHANQGLLLFILEVIVGIIVSILSLVLNMIPFVGPIFSGIISGILFLGCLALAIFGIVNAAQGNYKQLPVIGTITIIK